jgi:SAM-dependent methyltransferase
LSISAINLTEFILAMSFDLWETASRQPLPILKNPASGFQVREELSKSSRPSSFDAWEAAYLKFETPEQEIRKFMGRLRRLGALTWPKDARVVELFCGRGNGLHALERLGFRNVEGADLSPALLAQYSGTAECYVSDCRHLPFAPASKDVAIVQGGLHHLSAFPDDLDETFAEIRRVLASDGQVVFVEPWLTRFLRIVHALSENRLVRRVSPKLDALATMIENEQATYEQWLNHPTQIRAIARKHFVPVLESFAWGKWSFVGKPRC